MRFMILPVLPSGRLGTVWCSAAKTTTHLVFAKGNEVHVYLHIERDACGDAVKTRCEQVKVSSGTTSSRTTSVVSCCYKHITKHIHIDQSP